MWAYFNIKIFCFSSKCSSNITPLSEVLCYLVSLQTPWHNSPCLGVQKGRPYCKWGTPHLTHTWYAVKGSYKFHDYLLITMPNCLENATTRGWQNNSRWKVPVIYNQSIIDIYYFFKRENYLKPPGLLPSERQCSTGKAPGNPQKLYTCEVWLTLGPWLPLY